MGKKRNVIIDLSKEEEVITKRKKAEIEKGEKEALGQKTAENAGTTKESGKTKKPQKAAKTKDGKGKIRGKKYMEARKKVDKSKIYSLGEAVALIKDIAYSKGANTLEMAINLGIDPSKQEHRIKTSVSLPHFSAKEKRILSIDAGDKSTVAKIEKGELAAGRDFDLVVAHPSVMKEVAKVAKILGPKGIMPNPKNGTVSENVKKTAEELKGKNAIELKTQKGQAVIHAVLGNAEQKNEDLIENAEKILDAVKKAKPSKLKKAYIKSVYISSTMSPSLRIA